VEKRGSFQFFWGGEKKKKERGKDGDQAKGEERTPKGEKKRVELFVGRKGRGEAPALYFTMGKGRGENILGGPLYCAARGKGRVSCLSRTAWACRNDNPRGEKKKKNQKITCECWEGGGGEGGKKNFNRLSNKGRKKGGCRKSSAGGKKSNLGNIQILSWQKGGGGGKGFHRNKGLPLLDMLGKGGRGSRHPWEKGRGNCMSFAANLASYLVGRGGKKRKKGNRNGQRKTREKKREGGSARDHLLREFVRGKEGGGKRGTFRTLIHMLARGEGGGGKL